MAKKKEVNIEVITIGKPDIFCIVRKRTKSVFYNIIGQYY